MQTILFSPGHRIAGVSGTDIISTFFSALYGIMAVTFSYLIPIRDIVHFILFLFFWDIVFGAWAANKVFGEKFSVKVIWNKTVPRMLLSIVLVLSCFLWDTVYKQGVFSTHRIIGWFISGMLIWSITVNGYRVTRWNILPRLGEIIKKQLNIIDDESYKKN